MSDALKSLKNNKSCGLDKISNEMLRYGQIYFNKALLKIFNTILSSGIFPQLWCKGFITPIFKSGCKTGPDNFRGITINSSLGKHFTRILNARLDKYLEEHDIISHEQIGFTKGKRTTDHMFILKKTLIDKHTQKGSKPHYTCFVDFKNAFDTVDHTALFYKLRKIGIGDSFYNVI